MREIQAIVGLLFGFCSWQNLVIILTKVTITLGFCSTPNWVMLPVNTLLTDIFPQMMILRKETNFLLRSPCPKKLFEFFMKSCPSPFSSITQASLRYWLKVTYCWLSNMLGACEHQASLIPLSSCALTSMESWRVAILGDGGTEKTQLATQVSMSEFHWVL